MSDIRHLLNDAARRLAGLSDSPRLDAELLLCHSLNRTRSYLIAHSDEIPNECSRKTFEHGLEKCINGQPIAYIIGTKSFWSLDLSVNPDVLIPRPETELLVEATLEQLSHARQSDKPPHIIDLGTGSGAIALSIASELPDTIIFATDISQASLDIAQTNARHNGLDNIRFLHAQADAGWYGHVADMRFDVIVSNPPYIAENDPHLLALSHEPRHALVSGHDGLNDLRQIISHAREHLHRKGWLILEHGHDQGNAVRQMMQDHGLSRVSTQQDLAGHDRITLGQAP